MFCSNCGKQLGPGTNFCPACGTRVMHHGEAPFDSSSVNDQERSSANPGIPEAPPQASWGSGRQPWHSLVRPRSPRILGGVCAAFALHFGWNLDLVRIVTAVFGLFYGIGILAYLACWIIFPEAQYALPSRSR